MIRIEIDTGNAAFADHPEELSRILQYVAAHAAEIDEEDGLNLYDVNGNRVGRAYRD